MSGGSEGVAINGVPSVARTETKRFTAYISPYLTVRNGGEYTKHVYMGNERITSKVSNSGIFGTSPVNDTLQAKYQLQTAKIKERFDTLGVKYNGSTQLGGLISNSPSSAEGSYFYHSDHLGSSSLITSQLGDIVQHLEYVPFGETFIDQRNGSWNTPYLFNGKERDEETGLLYVHARYQDSKYGIWYSVDPLAEKFANWSSYVYSFNNPVKYVDFDGKRGVNFRQIRTSNNNQNVRYGLYPNGQMPLSYNKTTTYAPRNSTNPNGARPIVSQPAPGQQYPAYVETMTTAGGNNVQITSNNSNKQGKLITAVTEYMKDRLDNISLFSISQDVVFNERGVDKSTLNINILDPNLVKAQQNYDNLAADINKELGPIDYSKAKTSAEFIQCAADRYSQIESKIGKSPISIIQKEMLLNNGKFKSTSTEIKIIPEFRQGQ